MNVEYSRRNQWRHYVITSLTEKEAEHKIRSFSYEFRPITTHLEGFPFPESGRTGTKAGRLTNRISMKATKEKNLKRLFVVQFP